MSTTIATPSPAYFGTIGTEKGVRYAKEAARWAQVQGLDADTRRKLDTLARLADLAAPETPGAATELNTIATRLQSTYAKGTGDARRQVDLPGDEVEALMGSTRDPAKLAEMWKSWHETSAADARRLSPHGRASPTPARRSWASPTPARCGARATT